MNCCNFRRNHLTYATVDTNPRSRDDAASPEISSNRYKSDVLEVETRDEE